MGDNVIAPSLLLSTVTLPDTLSMCTQIKINMSFLHYHLTVCMQPIITLFGKQVPV